MAGSTFVAALICALAAQYFLSPGLLFSAGSVTTGVFVFLAWLSATREKTSQTTVFAALAIAALLGSVASELGSSLAVIMATGLSHCAAALFGLAGLAKWRRNSGHR